MHLSQSHSSECVVSHTPILVELFAPFCMQSPTSIGGILCRLPKDPQREASFGQLLYAYVCICSPLTVFDFLHCERSGFVRPQLLVLLYFVPKIPTDSAINFQTTKLRSRGYGWYWVLWKWPYEFIQPLQSMARKSLTALWAAWAQMQTLRRQLRTSEGRL